MAIPQPLKLPCELEEDILSRLPPQSLVRFRTVCQEWNSLFSNKRFRKNHLSRSRPEFILLTTSKTYSIEIIIDDGNIIDPKIKVRELPSSDIPNRDTNWYYTTTIATCDDFLFYNYRHDENKTALWNPWLRQVRWIEYENKKMMFVFGLGYDNSRPEKVYKILGYSFSHGKVVKDQRVAIYECASHVLRFIDRSKDDWPGTDTAHRSCVSLNGNLYWFACKLHSDDEYFIQMFDFSKEMFKSFCLLPCQKSHYVDELQLAVYKGDRFSLLKQSCVTREIGIWVTKKRIGNNNDQDGGEGVEWIKLMTLSTTNLPKLFGYKIYRISYFIYEKTLFVCCGDDETGVACIYVAREDMCKKIQIHSEIFRSCHCVYTPNLISLPSLN